ncbi:HK97 gp10 family phage protein [Shinella curvata]|uniref:HK97 gp10 family phage protein n=1 Tax=Shinella curvata TaxID=1817964 RepID=A0ABT8XHL2_9HYPH|nr:HK97-gp10 family putative phage morphogenesis protein [Shinella curvata]MCJ8053890.1 HK97 gp10 family phage protein [Shinella curvata]MDO6123222.1 HK97 gp10 family phage protein [Shinella curvata]
MADDGGLSRIQQRMAMIPRRVREAVTPALIKEGNDLAVTMRILAPDDPATDAPDLRSSIEVTGPSEQTPPYSQPGGSMVVPENAVAVTVGNADVRYPHLVEYGTTKATAQPFFWPTVRLQRKKATNAIKRAIRKAVKDNWGSRK